VASFGVLALELKCFIELWGHKEIEVIEVIQLVISFALDVYLGVVLIFELIINAVKCFWLGRLQQLLHWDYRGVQ